MHKVFVNNKPIILTTEVEKETNFKNYLLNTVHIGKVIKDLKGTNLESVRLIDADESKLLKNFLKLLPNVIAAGGKVYNPIDQVLFIYRNDKWDLPKGGAERKETIDQAAIREVEEETGVSGLSITKPLEMTYHIFKRNGQHKIKVTYWFEMRTDFTGELIPQAKEGITKAKWLTKEQIDVAMNNSYANIKLLV